MATRNETASAAYRKFLELATEAKEALRERNGRCGCSCVRTLWQPRVGPALGDEPVNVRSYGVLAQLPRHHLQVNQKAGWSLVTAGVRARRVAYQLQQGRHAARSEEVGGYCEVQPLRGWQAGNLLGEAEFGEAALAEPERAGGALKRGVVGIEAALVLLVSCRTAPE
jgi:hypothetical protein